MKRPLSLVTCLLVPSVILLFGLIFAAAFAYKEFPKMIAENGRGPIPPGFGITLEKPAKYGVWLHSYALFEGTAYEHEEKMPPGGTILVIDKNNGDKLQLQPVLAKVTKSVGSESAVSVGTFETYRKMDLEVIGAGFESTAIVSISEMQIGASLGKIVTFLTIIIMTLFFAILFLIVLLHRRQRMLMASARF